MGYAAPTIAAPTYAAPTYGIPATTAVAPGAFNPYTSAVYGGVGEIDRVNAFGQVVERDFVGGLGTRVLGAPAVPQVYAAPAARPATTVMSPYGAQVVGAPAVYGGVGEIDRVNAFGQVVERDFVGGVPGVVGAPVAPYPYAAPYPYGAPF